MLRPFPLLWLLSLSIVTGWRVHFHRGITAALIGGSTFATLPSDVFAEPDVAIVSNIQDETARRPQLTAKDLLQNDISMRRQALQEIEFTVKLTSPMLENKDYPAIRTMLRVEPTKSLRKTCRNLRKYLPSPEAQAAFDKVYDELIENVGQYDVLCLKRMQGENVPPEGQADSEIAALLEKATSSLDKMIELTRQE